MLHFYIFKITFLIIFFFQKRKKNPVVPLIWLSSKYSHKDGHFKNVFNISFVKEYYSLNVR